MNQDTEFDIVLDDIENRVNCTCSCSCGNDSTREEMLKEINLKDRID